MTDPQRLVAGLTARGWVPNPGRGYVRFMWPGLREHGSPLLVPTDTSAPDFDELWRAAIGELEDAVATGVQAAYVLAGMVDPYSAGDQGHVDGGGVP